MTFAKKFQHKDAMIDEEFSNIYRTLQSKSHGIEKTLPNAKEGVDGEIRVYSPSSESYSLMIKVDGIWREFDIRSIEATATILNALNFSQGLRSARPTKPEKVMLYYETDTGQLMFYTLLGEGEWIIVG